MDLRRALRALAGERPLYHSEADFQHALAWEIHQHLPHASVRLELPVRLDDATLRADLWIGPRPGAAVELKCAARLLRVACQGEEYALRNQDAQDLLRYDFLNDIARLERLVASGAVRDGAAVLLATDASLWSSPAKPDCIDAPFRLHEGRVLDGTLGWAPAASLGSSRDREEAITLAVRYPLSWADDSALPATRNGTFRHLVVPVG